MNDDALYIVAAGVVVFVFLRYFSGQTAAETQADVYFKMTPLQQKQFVDSLSPDERKKFMNVLRQAKMARVNSGRANL